MTPTTIPDMVSQAAETVTFAATFLAGIEKQTAPLDDRDRATARRIRVQLEQVEKLLYCSSQAAATSGGED